MPRPSRSNSKTRTHAIELRKELTPAERKLWAYLRGNKFGNNFRRQHAIGNYIADFCCPKEKLIIELDGSHHIDQHEYDNERTLFLESKGYKVIRFWNNDVLNNIEAVLKVIWDTLKEEIASPTSTARTPALVGGARDDMKNEHSGVKCTLTLHKNLCCSPCNLYIQFRSLSEETHIYPLP